LLVRKFVHVYFIMYFTKESFGTLQRETQKQHAMDARVSSQKSHFLPRGT
jgi:hypothetical protein